MPEIIIDPKELAKIYHEKTNAEAAKFFKISATTLTRLVKLAGIPLKGQGRKKARIKLAE